jgi:hypothetical protein
VAYKDAFLHYFCDGERVRNGNWILSNVGIHDPLADYELKAERLESWFREDHDLWFDHIMRLVYFDGAQYGFPGTHYATVNLSGDCRIQLDVAARRHRKRVRLDSPFKTHQAPARAATVKAQLFAALDDEDSEARFALGWLHLSPSQQKKKLLRLEQETLEPTRQLLRAALQSQAGIWGHNRSLLWRMRNYQEKPFSRLEMHDETLFIQFPTGSGLMEIPPRLFRWKWAIWNHFISALQNKWLFFALCVRGWPDVATVEVKANPPSAHEAIEAGLLLRAWWDENLPPELFQALNADESP